MSDYDEIRKVFNNRIQSGIPIEQACIFDNDVFPNISRDILENLKNKGYINLWINDGFELTEYGIKQFLS